MYPSTPGSESSSNLYSGSDTDDPTHGSSLNCDPPAIAKGPSPHHGTESRNMKAEHNTNIEKEVGQSNRRSRGFNDCATGHEVPEISSLDNKRKRTEDDIGEPRISRAPSPDHIRISFSGKVVDYRSRTASETDMEGPNSSGLTVKRTRFDEPSSVSQNGPLVGEFSQNNPDLVSSLNPQIWRRVFCFVPPVFLGRLLRVNRFFHSLLSPDIPHMPVHPMEHTGSAIFQSSEAIWAASRRRFCPGLPKPLRGLHELQMWRLLRGSDCQLCGERSNLLTPSAASNPWESGPGSTGVRVIWPFGIRCCGKCLRIHSEKEVTLLFSSTFPSFLLQALPIAFISQSEHFVTSMTLRNAIPPSDVQLTKHYYKLHVEEIKRQLQCAKELGSGSAEEWIKGLENEGQEKCNDIARWEQWEVKGGLKKVNVRPNSKIGSSMARQTPALASATKMALTSGDGNNEEVITGEDPAAPLYGSSTALETTSPVTLTSSAFTSSTAHGSLPQRPQLLTPQVKPERNIRDVNEAKAARRAEIERRCLNLEPPLEANVLFHMESFQAALQISTVLTDNAWEILKPRLLVQRESAELHERERIHQSRLLQTRSEERKRQEAQLKETKELLDKEWDTIQAPIRERLSVFADEVIKASWAGGSSVTMDNCPTFAADVLLYARRRFYDDVVQEDNARRAGGETVRADSPNDPPTRKLILENMKWLFDNKVKNFTEQFQKDLFLCNGCQGNFKFYGFEGVIQHYAAKHTTSLSMGSVVVHWRAEWPEHPPFNPDPSIAKASYYSVPPPISSSAQNQYSRPPQTIALYGEYAQMVAPPVQPPQGYGSQYSPSSYQVHYPIQLQNDRYQLLPTVLNGYSQTSIYNGPPAISQPGIQYHTPRPENPAVLALGYQSRSMNSATRPQLNHMSNSFNPYPPAAQQLPYAAGYLPRYPGGSYPASQSTVSPANPVPTYFTRVAPNYEPKNMSGADLHNTQMNEMAHQARCVWFETSGIKDIPQSVRIFIVIHHMVLRFMQRYAMEPSLAMFIDGLNHNPLMRPVRSLNGLACKTCVTLGSGSGDEYHTHPRPTATDRKLYTLPHLLNHFKSVHVERMQSAVDLHSGLESSRLDWKRDMIELPEIPLIANLVNTPGINKSKFQLIAAVFPNIFPGLLPIEGPVRHPEPIFTNGIGHNAATVQQYDRSSGPDIAPMSPSQAETQFHSEATTPLRAESMLRMSSRTSTRASEPPGDDEYDPNRPTYYGKIVDSRQFPTRNAVYDPSSTNVIRMRPTAMPHLESTHDEAYPKDFQPRSSHDKQLTSDDDQAERIGGYEALHFNAARSGLMGLKGTPLSMTATKLRKTHSSNFGDSSRYVSEDGELVEEPVSVHQNRISASDVADVTAAERFLNDFNPGVGQNGDRVDADQRDRGSRNRPSRQKTVEILAHQLSDSVGRAAEVVPVERTANNAQYNVRSNPSFIERIEPRNGDNLQFPYLPNDHRQFYDPLSETAPHARHRYTEDFYPTGGLSTRVYDTHTTSHAAHISPGIDKRNMSVPRTARNPSQWSHTETRRSRSRSPVQVARTLEQYHVRSPRQRSPHAPLHHFKPPTPPSDGHAQRNIQYAYPADQNAVARPRMAGYPEEYYGQRIEYIPIRENNHEYQERGRYMIAQPVEQTRSKDQIQIERNYVGDEVFETDGYLYYAARRQADARPVRATNPAYVEYRADLR
ncbi:hypothetical protein MMC17_001463 [Xylographa soralifera]|nr:hypothetical protein [Xylographa soralifera]